MSGPVLRAASWLIWNDSCQVAGRFRSSFSSAGRRRQRMSQGASTTSHSDIRRFVLATCSIRENCRVSRHRSCRPPVVMVQPSEHRQLDDLALGGSVGGDWRLVIQGLVGSGLVVEGGILVNHAIEVPVVQDDDVVETLPAKRPKQAFADGIHVWRANRSLDDINARGFRQRIEGWPVFAVPITQQEARSAPERRRVEELLRDPGPGREARRRNVHDLACRELDKGEGEYGSEKNVIGLQKVASPDVPSMILEKARPALTARSPSIWGTHILLDSALADPDVLLQEFPSNALSTP